MSATPMPAPTVSGQDTLVRVLDVLLSGSALLVLSPLLVVIALVLRLTGEHEVLYRQRRVGQHGREFDLVKFATMLKDSPNLGAGLLTLKDDPRVLPFGRLLRRTKLNELPQLFNVLAGDMSLIGPRPLAPVHFGMYAPELRALLSTVRPGLSGLGSIVFRSEDEIVARAVDRQAFYANVVSRYKGQIEAWAIEHRSLRLYLLLIGLTLWITVRPASELHRRLLPGLPPMPDALAGPAATNEDARDP